MEIEGMREYNRILDEQEAQRAAALESRISRQKELADARAVEMERNKEQKLRQMRLETQDFLFAQMEEKEARKHQAMQLKSLQARILDEDTKEYMDMEKHRAVERKRTNMEHRLELDEQIKRKNQDTKEFKYCMSGNEVSMNKQLLEVVEKTLVERDDDAEAVAVAE